MNPPGPVDELDPRAYRGAETVNPLRPTFPANAVLLWVPGFGGSCEVCQCTFRAGLTLDDGQLAASSPQPTELHGVMTEAQYSSAVELVSQHARRYVRPQIVWLVWIICCLVPFLGSVIAWGILESDNEEDNNRRRPYFYSFYSFVMWGFFALCITFNAYVSFVINTAADRSMEAACKEITASNDNTVWTFVQWFEGCGRPGKCVSVTVRGVNDNPAQHQVSFPVRPMPPGWEERTSANGQVIYANVVTGQTMFERPYH